MKLRSVIALLTASLVAPLVLVASPAHACERLSIPRLGINRCVVVGGQAEIDAGEVVRLASISSSLLSWVGAHRTSHGASFFTLTNLRIGEDVEYDGRTWRVEEYQLVNRLAPVEVYPWFYPTTPRLVLQTSSTGGYVHVWRAELAVTVGAPGPGRSQLPPLPAQAIEALAGPGAYEAVTPSRVLDTRSGEIPAAGSTIAVPTDGVVPAGATAVLANVTATEATADGFLTAWPTMREMPLSSVVNIAPGDTRANAALVPLGSDGRFQIFTSAPTHIVVDISGYWMETTGSTRAGRFVPLEPTRLEDTRSRAPSSPVSPGAAHTVALPASVPDDARGVALIVTVTEATADGFWTVYTPGSSRPVVSTVNVSAGGTRANLAWVAPSDRSVSVLSQSGGHLVVDLVGYVTGQGAQSAQAGRFVPLSPTRFLDTRTEAAKPSARSVRTVGGLGVRNLPAATALAGNLTITSAAQAGYATAWPAGGSQPLTSNGNIERSGQTVATAFSTGVGPSGTLSVAASVPTEIVVDLTGYFTL